MERGRGTGLLRTRPTRRRKPHQIVVRGQDVFVVQPGAPLHPGAVDEVAHAVQDPEKGALAALGRPHEAEDLPGADR